MAVIHVDNDSFEKQVNAYKNFSKTLKCSRTVCTQTQPKSGIKVWKKAKIPATENILRFFIHGSFKPLASETEKASIASPTPKKMLLKKKVNERFKSKPPKMKKSKRKTALATCYNEDNCSTKRRACQSSSSNIVYRFSSEYSISEENSLASSIWSSRVKSPFWLKTIAPKLCRISYPKTANLALATAKSKSGAFAKCR